MGKIKIYVSSAETQGTCGVPMYISSPNMSTSGKEYVNSLKL